VQLFPARDGERRLGLGVDSATGRPYVHGVRSPLAEQLVAGIAARDQTAIAACFAPDAPLRALTPPGLRERNGASAAGAMIAAWFGDSTVLELVETEADEVGDRLHIWYRFAGVEDGEAYIVEQHLFCTCWNERIERADLLCSGFRPPARG